MRKIKVLVHNDKERNAVPREFEREGVKWNEGQSAMEYKPKKQYPYYIYRGGALMHGTARGDSWFSGYKEVPASTFLKLDKDAEIEEIMVMVHNDKERDAVLRQFERDGYVWVNSRYKPTAHEVHVPYPYYIYQDSDGISWGYSRHWIEKYKTVSVRTFLELDELDKELNKLGKDVITITSDGKTVTAEMGDKKGVAKCSPDDEFSLRTGAKLALDRMFGLQVGDEVRVKEIFMVHEWAKDFMLEHCSKEMCARFAYGKTPNMHETLTIVGIYLHRGSQWAVCERKGVARELFAINVKGLEKID